MGKFVRGVAKIARVAVRPFFPVKVYGERNIPNKKCLIVGNHVSGWDPLIFTMWTKNILSFVYKAEFVKVPFLKWFFDELNCVPVRRGDIDINATKQILRLLHDDKAVFLFPEGTRNPNVDTLQEFRTGAALFALKTQSPIRPFYIWDKTKALRKNYIIVGDEFTLDEFYTKPINHETLVAATAVIKEKVEELRVKLNAHLAAKGIKRRKRTQKETDKLKAYNRKQHTFEKKLAAEKQSLSEQQSVDNKEEGGAS